ncbi:MAG: hypothetical protein D6674_04950 [Acidobacteria bacterium]|jgi:predicted membrane protein|nr:MAG: hypothetical protein D6674_04950 [Acidobacteriota bacterium]
MENLISLLLFFGKLLLLMALIGVPLFVVIAFVADKVYKRVGPRYEELKEKRIRELQEKAEDKRKDKKKYDKNHSNSP